MKRVINKGQKKMMCLVGLLMATYYTLLGFKIQMIDQCLIFVIVFKAFVNNPFSIGETLNIKATLPVYGI